MKYYILIVFILISLSGCKKDKNLEEITETSIEGYIVNSITGDSIPGVRVNYG